MNNYEKAARRHSITAAREWMKEAIAEQMAATGLPFEAVPPKNNITKMTADYFRAITGWTGRTSEHARDAAMLVIGRR